MDALRVTVGEADLERHLARLVARRGDPRAGLYGPGSLSWEINREAIVMLGGGCAALLQLAHPFVAHAVAQHSRTATDPVGRFQRTFQEVFAMVFGDLDQALASARRVHALHRTIRGAIREDVGRFKRGDRYHANDEHALFWVHATLVDTALRVYELCVVELSPLEREAYYAESKLFAYLFGIPDEVLPATWPAFEQRYAEVIRSDTIAVGEPARELRRLLFRPPRPSYAPVVAWLEAFTAHLLPEKLREPYGLPYGPREQAVVRLTLPVLRAAHRAAPRRLKYFPAYEEARRRIAGQTPHDRLGRWVEERALRSMAPR